MSVDHAGATFPHSFPPFSSFLLIQRSESGRFADGAGAAAQFNGPLGVVVDGEGRRRFLLAGLQSSLGQKCPRHFPEQMSSVYGSRHLDTRQLARLKQMSTNEKNEHQ